MRAATAATARPGRSRRATGGDPAPHGITDAGSILAIDKDPDAAIFGIAALGPVGHQSRGRTVLRACAIVAAVAFVVWLLLHRDHGLRINLELSSTAAGPGEIFHAAEGEPFAPGNSVPFDTTGDGTVQRYRVDIVTPEPVARLRLDPARAPGSVELRRLQVRGKAWELKTGRFDVPLEPAAAHQVGSLAAAGDALRFESLGEDPSLEFLIPPETLAGIEQETQRLRWLLALACGLGVALLDAVLRFGRRAKDGLLARAGRMQAWLARLEPAARALSDEGTIVFTPASLLVVVLALLVAVAGIAGRIHLSSVGMWDAYLPTPEAADPVLVGKPRAIRSDEWLVNTPWMMSQAAKGFPMHNPSVGPLNGPLVTSLPVRHAIAAFQPEFWGFALFAPERAVSWFWMYKTVGLFLAAFLLLLLLTRGDTLLAFLGSGWLYLSSFTQWWFSNHLPELLIGLCLALLGFLSICMATRRATFAVGIVAFLLGAATFAFQLYPAFQVPLAYLAVAVVAGMAVSRANRTRVRRRMGWRLAALAGCAAVLGVLAHRFAIDAAATIEVVSGTVYPGQRSTVGGSVPWWMAFDGVFEGLRVGEQAFPWPGSNASESSDFGLLFPLVIAAMPWHRARSARDGVVLTLAGFCVVLLAWMTVPLPDALADGISRFLLLSYVPPSRAPVALGVASILLATVWMARLAGEPRHPSRMLPLLFAAGAALLTGIYGARLQDLDPVFFTNARLVVGTALVTLGAWAMVRGSRPAFAVFVAVAALPGLTVNPVARGLAPMLDKPVLAAAVAASEADGQASSARWIVPGSFVIPQAFKAVGLDVFGGATYAPDHQAMAVLDPGMRSADVWNRYAHIQVESDSSVDAPAFDLVQTDLYRLRVDVCGPELTALGINRAAYMGEAPEADRACLRRIGGPVQGFTLYARTAD